MLTDYACRLLTRELKTMMAEVHATPEVSLLWTCPPGVTNPIGTLALHLAGNLRHFVGAGLGSTGYVRDREREFAARDLPHATLIAELEAAAAEVSATLPGVSPAQLESPLAIAGTTLPTGLFLMHLCGHAAFHVGQAGYLRRLLTGENRSTGTVSILALSD